MNESGRCGRLHHIQAAITVEESRTKRNAVHVRLQWHNSMEPQAILAAAGNGVPDIHWWSQ